MPIIRMTSWATSTVGITWLTIEFRPNVASTAENASSTGIPAATSAPNAINRMIMVSGRETLRAFAKSALILSLRTCVADASPNSRMERSGLAARSDATPSITGWMRSGAVSLSPEIWNRTSAECPSLVIWPG